MQAIHDQPALESKEKPIIDLLDRHLASAIDLQLRISDALWNAEDPRVVEIRELSKTASEMERFCELIADRLRSLGTVAHATLQRAQARSFLDPYPIMIADDHD